MLTFVSETYFVHLLCNLRTIAADLAKTQHKVHNSYRVDHLQRTRVYIKGAEVP